MLGRQAVWPPGRFSILAGFVEPGESAEAAVVREVAEEVGLRVTDVRYVGSQPWPFPQSLMLGFVARAEAAGELVLDPDEIEEARWFTRERAASRATGPPALPPPVSIARHIIDRWLAGEFDRLPQAAAAAQHERRAVGVVGQHDGVGQGGRVDLVVVAVEGRQLPRLLGRGPPAPRGRADPQVDDDVEGQPDALQQRSGDQQHAAGRHRAAGRRARRGRGPRSHSCGQVRRPDPPGPSGASTSRVRAPASSQSV